MLKKTFYSILLQYARYNSGTEAMWTSVQEAKNIIVNRVPHDEMS